MSSRQLDINLELSNRERRIGKFMTRVLEVAQGLTRPKKNFMPSWATGIFRETLALEPKER